MSAQYQQEGNGPATGAVIVPYYQMQEHEWTLARAFLYSLTVLTTIGKSFHSILSHIYIYIQISCVH